MNTKKINIVIFSLLLAVSSAFFYGCREEGNVFIVLNKTGQLTMERGDTLQFSANVQTVGDVKVSPNVTWSSTAPEVGTIDQQGMFQALSVGKTEVKASLSNGKYAMVEINVSAESAKEIIITPAKMNLELTVKDTIIIAKVNPQKILDIYTPEWTSDKPDVVQIGEIKKYNDTTTVRLKPLKTGKATIKLKLGKKEAFCVVTVLKKVDILQEEIYLQENGRDGQLDAVISESVLAAGDKIEWMSTNESVARVKLIRDVTGKSTATIQPLAEGDAKIIISAGAQKDTCVVHVGAIVELNWIKNGVLVIKSVTLYLNEEQDLPVFAIITPDLPHYINSMEYVWTNSNPSVVQITSTGIDPNDNKSSVAHLKAGALKGISEITVTARGQTIKAIVTVKDRNDTPVESITITPSSATVNVGSFVPLTAEVLPLGSAAIWPVSWSSSNPAIAKVDANGQVTGVAAGSVVITAVSKDKSATATVTVQEAVTSITIKTDTRNVLMVDDSETWSADVFPASAAAAFPKTWSSANTAIASVDAASGKITAKAVGKTTITVKASDKQATREVQVVPLEANVDFGISIDGGGWELKNNVLTVKAEDGSGIYDFIFNMPNTTLLQNKVYTIGTEISLATMTWSHKTPQIEANITSGTLEVQAGANSDEKNFIFNLNIKVGNTTITVKGNGKLLLF